ncbi:hypothetical protein V6N12_033149 [Hibiscus sabdariffa]|uniref:DNA sliding clamp PCNA n=1 Tax=Hibiscus sabdariffa TaxID=183260 RepID=A0ABR2BEN4_9ROSI
MLELRLFHGSLLKKVLKAIKGLVRNANFYCSADGVSLQAMIPTNVAVLSLFLSPQGFQHYHCDDNITLGMNLNNLYKKLRRCRKGDTVTITAKHGQDAITFTYHRPSHSSAFQETITFDAIIRMPSPEFARICEGLGSIGDTVVVSVTKEKVKFSTRGGDNITANTVLRQHKDRVQPAENATTIEMTNPVSLEFELRHMNSFTKATTLSKTVEIGLRSKRPVMLVEYNIGDKGYVRFYLREFEDA